jgi:hypothetical protein
LPRILEEASRDNHEPHVLPLETPFGHLIECFALGMKDGSGGWFHYINPVGLVWVLAQGVLGFVPFLRKSMSQHTRDHLSLVL